MYRYNVYNICIMYFLSGTNYEAITNGECTSVGIEEHAEFLFTVSADQVNSV